MRGISNIFRQSPFENIQEHMQEVLKCVRLLRPLFEALVKEDYERVEELANKIIELENLSDKKKNVIRNNLPKDIFLPVSRRDLLQIVNAQDSIADTAEDIANLLLLRRTEVPDDLKESLFEFLDEVLDACEQAKSVTDELLELFKRSFGGPEVIKINAMLEKLDSTEAKTEKLCTDLAKSLFKIEDKMSPISVIFWYKIIEEIGNLADYAKKMGNRLGMLIAK
ncbi:MAG: TIGR00153 family protein [Cyanobacteriota bacterium]